MFNEEEYKKSMAVLREIRVSIDNDPVRVGLDAINRKLSEVQDARDKVTSIISKAIENKTNAKVVYDMRKTEYGMEVDRLLAEDEDVRKQKSADVRKASANVKSASLQLEDHAAKIDLLRAEGYLQTAMNIYENLKASYDTLSRQISTMHFQHEIGGITAEDFGRSTPTNGKKLRLKGDRE